MSRARTLLTVMIPSMLAGGVLFGSAFSSANTGRDGAESAWPAADVAKAAQPGVRVAQVDPRPRPRPRPAPTAPTPPTPPEAPEPPQGWAVPPVPPVPPPAPVNPYVVRPRHGGGVTVSIHDGKVQISGIEEMVEDQLAAVHDLLDNNPDIPRDVRDRLKERMGKVRSALKAHLGVLKHGDASQIGPEMEQMGSEIEAAMSGLDGDLAKLNDKLGKDFSKQFEKQFAKSWKGFGPGKFKFSGGTPGTAVVVGGNSDDNGDGDHDDDHDDEASSAPGVPDIDIDDHEDTVATAMHDLRGMALRPDQRAQLKQLRADTEASVASAKRALDEQQQKLEDALRNPSTPDTEIMRQVQQISSTEATIRTAKLLAWHRARRMLDDGQRAHVEASVHKKSR